VNCLSKGGERLGRREFRRVEEFKDFRKAAERIQGSIRKLGDKPQTKEIEATKTTVKKGE